MAAWSRAVTTVLALVLILASGSESGIAEPVSALHCENRTVRDAGYLICSIALKIARPRLFWKGAGDEPYRTFDGVAEAVAAGGKSLVFAMNAGMYAEDFSPMGLYVEDGREVRPANRIEMKAPPGAVPNFYKKPNGIFFLTETEAGILPTGAFVEKRLSVRFATQSGPMLVIDGKVNSIFIPGSTDRTRRSGVGVCEGNAVRFAISDGPVNFHDFATLFQDDLKCPDALFLDGGRGAGIYVPAMDRKDWSGHGGYGPMVGLVE